MGPTRLARVHVHYLNLSSVFKKFRCLFYFIKVEPCTVNWQKNVFYVSTFYSDIYDQVVTHPYIPGNMYFVPIITLPILFVFLVFRIVYLLSEVIYKYGRCQ